MENQKRQERDGVRAAAFHARYGAAAISATTSAEISTPHPLGNPTYPFHGPNKRRRRETVWDSLPPKTPLDYPSSDVKRLCKTLVCFLRDVRSGVKEHPVDSNMLRWLNTVITKQKLRLPQPLTPTLLKKISDVNDIYESFIGGKKRMVFFLDSNQDLHVSVTCGQWWDPSCGSRHMTPKEMQDSHLQIISADEAADLVFCTHTTNSLGCESILQNAFISPMSRRAVHFTVGCKRVTPPSHGYLDAKFHVNLTRAMKEGEITFFRRDDAHKDPDWDGTIMTTQDIPLRFCSWEITSKPGLLFFLLSKNNTPIYTAYTRPSFASKKYPFLIGSEPSA